MRVSLSFALVALLCSSWACSDDSSKPSGGGGEEPAVNGPPESFALAPDGAGWVGQGSNTLGVQGAWATRTGAGSTITLTFDGPNVCFVGEVAQIPQGGTNQEYWGAAATLDFCRPDPNTPPDASFALNSCPWAPELASKVVGVGFSVDGTIPAVLRAGFREQGRMDTPYVVVREVGEVVALFDDALVRNN